MILGHTVPAVREAEAPLLAAGEPLMLRAARALAGHVGAWCGAAPRSAPPRGVGRAGAGGAGGVGRPAPAGRNPARWRASAREAATAGARTAG